MSAPVPVPQNTLDPFSVEETNVAPVRVRLLHLETTAAELGRTHTDLDESKDVLSMPLFLHGGRVYIRRGADGVRHLYREVPEIPRLDTAATRSEEMAYVSGMLAAKAIVVDALADCAASRTTSRETAFAALVIKLEARLAALGKKP